MRNFFLISSGVDVTRAQIELRANEDLWNKNTLRQMAPGSPHREVEDVWLRMNDMTKCRQADSDPVFVDHREAINYPAMSKLPYVRQLVMSLMASVQGERLGRVMISRLSPGAQIKPHSDIGPDLTKWYDNEPYFSRFHVVLQGLPGSIFYCGEEEVNMRTGEIWLFRNDLEHSVVNNSSDDRIHVIADIRLPKLC
jgi:hypothetical protein